MGEEREKDEEKERNRGFVLEDSGTSSVPFNVENTPRRDFLGQDELKDELFRLEIHGICYKK